jgi:hypothetical protein
MDGLLISVETGAWNSISNAMLEEQTGPFVVELKYDAYNPKVNGVYCLTINI